MLIKDIMTRKIITATENDSLSTVAKKMLEYNIGFLPITSENKIIGVISDRDIVIRAVIHNEKTNSRIDKYITKHIIHVNENETLDDALNLMSKNKIKRLVVTNENKVTGILSLADIIQNYNGNSLITSITQIFEIKTNEEIFDVDVSEFIL